MKKKLIAFVALLFLFSSILFYLLNIECGQDISDLLGSENHKQVSILYQNYCIRCHGEADEGRNIDPEGNNVPYSLEEMKDLIHNGGNYMPGFREIKEPMLTELARYVQFLENF